MDTSSVMVVEATTGFGSVPGETPGSRVARLTAPTDG